MGKVRPEYIKSVSDTIYYQYKDSISNNFEDNKKLLNKVATIHSKRLRNKIAGYLVHLKRKESVIVIPPKKQKKPLKKSKKKKKVNRNKKKRRR